MSLGVGIAQAVVVEPQRWHGAGAEVLDHHIGHGHEFEKGLSPGFRLEVQGQAALVALQLDEHGVGIPRLVARVAADPAADGRGAKIFARAASHWPLHLHNRRAEVGEEARCQGAGPNVSQVENAHAV